MEELCHYPGKGGQVWQGHGPSAGGATRALGMEGTQRGDVMVALRTDEMRLGGCDGCSGDRGDTTLSEGMQ